MTAIIKCGMKLLMHSHTSTVASLKFGNGQVISFHILLNMFSLINAGINVNVSKKGHSTLNQTEHRDITHVLRIARIVCSHTHVQYSWRNSRNFNRSHPDGCDVIILWLYKSVPQKVSFWETSERDAKKIWFPHKSVTAALCAFCKGLVDWKKIYWYTILPNVSDDMFILLLALTFKVPGYFLLWIRSCKLP